MIALVQHTTATAAGGTLTVTLGAAPTVGNLLVMMNGKQGNNAAPVQLTGPTLTLLGSAHAKNVTQGDYGYLLTRRVESGDAAEVTFQGGGNRSAIYAEFSGIGGSPTLSGTSDDNNDTTLALAVSPGDPANFLVLAGFITYLNGGTVAANGSSIQVNGTVRNAGNGNGSIVLFYGEGSLTLGGTQSGATAANEYWWGAIGAHVQKGKRGQAYIID